MVHFVTDAVKPLDPSSVKSLLGIDGKLGMAVALFESVATH
jgi:hypothetical protein